MPPFSDIVRLSTEMAAASGIEIDGETPASLGFRVRRDKSALGRNVDISGRPGIVVELTVDGAAVAADAAVTGEIPPGAIVTVGNAVHRLRNALTFGGGDRDLYDNFINASRFGVTDVEPVERLTVEATREILRTTGAIDVLPAYLITAPNKTKGGTAASGGDMFLRPFWYTDAFAPSDRTGIAIAAATLDDTATRSTIGVRLDNLGPRTVAAPAAAQPWSSDANAFFGAGRSGFPSQTRQLFQTVGVTLATGVGIAVFDDVLTENWADETAVTFAVAEELSTWARFISEAITQRVVQSGDAATVETLSVAEWEIESARRPAAEAVTDRYGRVWNVSGFEAAGADRWRLEATRTIARDAA